MESNFRSKIKPIASLRKKFNSDCAFLGVLQHNPLKHIKAIKNRLGFPKLPDVERQSLEKELSKASKLLDHSEQFVPRKTK